MSPTGVGEGDYSHGAGGVDGAETSTCLQTAPLQGDGLLLPRQILLHASLVELQVLEGVSAETGGKDLSHWRRNLTPCDM